jgi:L-rhamnose mutarotase
LHGVRSELYGGYSNGVPLIHFCQAKHNSIHISPHAISGLFKPWKRISKARNFEVINSLQHVFEKWVECCKKCIAGQGR